MNKRKANKVKRRANRVRAYPCIRKNCKFLIKRQKGFPYGGCKHTLARKFLKYSKCPLANSIAKAMSRVLRASMRGEGFARKLFSVEPV